MAKTKKATKVMGAKAPKVPAKEKREPRGEVYEEKLSCAIPIEEVHAAGLQLANTIGARAAWLEKRKVENAKARDDRAYFDTRIEELGEVIKQQSVTRRVQCQDFFVTKSTGEVVIEVVRLDTNEVQLTREPDDEERQVGLDFGEAPPSKGKKKKGKPEDLAPAPGTLKGPAEVAAPPFGSADQEEREIDDPDLE